MLVAPDDEEEGVDAGQGLPIALSDAALKCLTKLTCLQLHVSSMHVSPLRDSKLPHAVCRCACCHLLLCKQAALWTLTILFRSKCSSACAQEPEQEPADGTMQPGITQLRHLARLHVGSHYGGTLCEFPPGFGTLSTLTHLSFAWVRAIRLWPDVPSSIHLHHSRAYA